MRKVASLEQGSKMARLATVGVGLALGWGLLFWALDARAQSFANPVVTQPQPVSGCGGSASCPGNVSGTISVTNTFQSLFAASQARKGCVVQNNSASNVMWVFVGPLALATKATALQLPVGATFYCSVVNDAVVSDQISLTGTSGDAYVAIQN